MKPRDGHNPFEAVDEFFRFAKERYEIFLKRQQGIPRPWTKDPVLATYSFCNIFREDDRVTIWLRENLRDPLADDPLKCIFATIAFRWFNRIASGQKIKPMLLEGWWDSDNARNLLAKQKPVVTGAYIIKTPNGMTKLDGVCWCIDQVYEDMPNLAAELPGLSLEAAHKRLRKYPYMGDFMAYEVITDMRHTPALSEAPDIMTWANPGPGAARGVNWLQFGRPGGYGRTSKAHRAALMEQMQQLVAIANNEDDDRWNPYFPKWEMREAEHTLCEYDKWKRGHSGEKLKRLYRGAL